MNTEEAFGIVLRKCRQGKSISQEKLAINCELDRTYISLLERGKRNPTLASIFKLAKELDIRPNELIKEVEKLVEDNN
ncbi:helix-turn-helix domain-containing protein [Sutcliffiella sp. NC1]|uniref:helix-turn-helix domain-containing protein n=1 Tax=Sutcliffiella sp. NC1 TaxID=3004096 RepID=UPI0022DE243D|nr:helix-turn-helix transcriptional regulator [Sutcliffiella sp. NC1]WBL15232.1 helix-turn-helix transcriptional regulator [Sutcliffiella sp. NC1]